MADLMCWKAARAQTSVDFVCQVKKFELLFIRHLRSVNKQTLVSFDHNANFYELVDKGPILHDTET